MKNKKQEEQLSWFDLDNYDLLKTMTEVQWLDQLMIRKRIHDLIAENNTEDLSDYILQKIEYFVNEITKCPIIDFKSQTFKTLWGDYKTYASDFDEFWNWNSNLGIHQITLEETLRTFRGIDEHRINHLNSYLDSNNQQEFTTKKVIKAEDWFSYSLDSMKNDYLQHLTLMVDLDFSDDLLVEQFAAQLKIYRKKLGSKNPESTSIKDFNKKNLIKFGVIPYIDIVHIWGKLNKLNKSQTEIADLITSTDNAWTPSNLKGSTIPWVNTILETKFLEKLSINAQIKNIEMII